MIIVPAGLFAQAQTQAPGRIFLANDEWPLTNVGFQQASDTGTFISNVLSWFKPGGAGKFHAYSRNLGLTGSLLAKAITDGGHAWTTGLNIPATVEKFREYDGIFLAATTVNNDILIEYVRQGGNIYLALGADTSDVTNFKTFLNAFGMSLKATTNEVEGLIPIESTHPLFKDVHALYQNNGYDLLELSASDPHTEVLVTRDSHGLYGIFDGPLNSFRRGDLDQNGKVDLSDPIGLLFYLFLGDPRPPCQDSADCDDNGALEITDGICVLSYLFTAGPAPSPPGPKTCGPDPTGDGLEACAYGAAACSE